MEPVHTHFTLTVPGPGETPRSKVLDTGALGRLGIQTLFPHHAPWQCEHLSSCTAGRSSYQEDAHSCGLVAWSRWLGWCLWCSTLPRHLPCTQCTKNSQAKVDVPHPSLGRSWLLGLAVPPQDEGIHHGSLKEPPTKVAPPGN